MDLDLARQIRQHTSGLLRIVFSSWGWSHLARKGIRMLWWVEIKSESIRVMKHKYRLLTLIGSVCSVRRKGYQNKGRFYLRPRSQFQEAERGS